MSREPIVDGIFYPAEAETLRDEILDLIRGTKAPPGDAFAIITPHAALQYTGALMSAAFTSASARKIKTVVILAPVHGETTDEIILPESSYFNTPMGSVPVNGEITEALLSFNPAIKRKESPHLEEHGIEVQLPFVQTIFPEASIVPILVGKAARRVVTLLANALQLVLSELHDTTLFVITTNISANNKKEISAREADLFLEHISAMDWEIIIEAAVKGEISSCGAHCVAAVFSFQNKRYRINVLGKNNSSEISPDGKNAIYYAAVAIYQ